MEDYNDVILMALRKWGTKDLTVEEESMLYEWASEQIQKSEPVTIDPILYKLRIAQMDVAVYSALLDIPKKKKKRGRNN